MNELNTEKLLDEFNEIDFNEWVKFVEQSLKGRSFESLKSKTYENIDLKPIYRKEEDANFINSVPGLEPFTRSAKTIIDKNKPWLITQNIITKNLKEFNQIAKNNVESGINSIKFDAELNNDFNEMLKDIDFDEVSIDLDITTNYKIVTHKFIKYLEEKNKSIQNVKGSFLFDIFENVLLTGNHPENFKESMESLKSNFKKYSSDSFSFLTIKSESFKEAGSNIIHELAFSFSKLIELILHLADDENDIEKILKNIQFQFSTGEDFFLELAKYRAFRILWNQTVKAYSLKDIKPKVYVKSLKSNKSNLDKHANLLRNTIEALAPILGGVNSIELSYFDSDDTQPSEFSQRINRNIQILLKEEFNLTEVIDPAGGSYYIEYLTNEIAKKSWKLFQEIETSGGFITNIKTGRIQDDIDKVAQQRIKDISTRKKVLIGTNKYPNLKDELERIDVKAFENIETEIKILKPVKLSEPFEILRENSLKFKKEKGDFPKVFVAAFGPLNKYKARLDFSNDFFRVGGIDTEFVESYDNIDIALEGLKKSELTSLIICSTDDIYSDIVPEFSKSIKEYNPAIKVILAGYPKDKIEQFKTAGVDEFIHVKADIVKVLTDLQNHITND